MLERALRLLVVAACMFCTLALRAQETQMVSGVVRDSLSGEPIPYATLLWLDAGGESLGGGVAKEDGSFQIGIPQEAVVLKAQSLGYNSQKMLLSEQLKNPIELLLAPSEEEIGQVVVTSRKKLIRLTSQGLSYDLKKDALASSSSLLDALRRVPMVTVDGKGNLQVKGGYVYSIYLNGKPFKMAEQAPSQVLQSMNAADIDRIEVITNPDASFSSEVGSVVLNIITSGKKIAGYSVLLTGSGSTQPKWEGGISSTLVTSKLRLSMQYNYTADIHIDQPYTQDRVLEQQGIAPASYHNSAAGGAARVTYNTGRGLLEYDIDSLNTLYMDAHLKLSGVNDRGKSASLWQQATLEEHETVERLRRYNTGSLETNAIYRNLRASDKKERFSIGYRYAYSPDTWDHLVTTLTDIETKHQRARSRGGLHEHSLQTDFLLWDSNSWALKTGLVGLLRAASAEVDYWDKALAEDDWQQRSSSHFSQHSGFLAAYLNSSLQLGMTNLSMGLRVEHSRRKQEQTGLKERYTNLYPQLGLSMGLSPQMQLSLSYRYAVRRPSLWLLNPYGDNIDSYKEERGNPSLRNQYNHNLSLSAMHFGEQHFLNFSLDYHHERHPLWGYIYASPGEMRKVYSTHINGAQKDQLEGTLYINYRPLSSLSLSGYASLGYHHFRAVGGEQQRNIHFFSQLQADLILSGGWLLGLQWLHMKNPPAWGYTFKPSELYSLYVSKSFLEDKLNLTLQLQNPLERYMRYERSYRAPHLESHFTNDLPGRVLSLRMSYKITSGKKARLDRNKSLAPTDLDRQTGVL